MRLWSARVTEFAAYGSLRHVGRAVLLALVVFPVIWVLFIASGTSFGPAVDDPKDFLITLLNGLTAAALYFVVASGFTLIFGLMRVVNMAHGAFFLLGRLHRAAHCSATWSAATSGSGSSSAQVSLAQWVVPALAGVAVVAGVGPAHAAALPALEPGPGPAPGADHDRDRDHPRRPDARPLRRRRAGHLLAGDVRQVRQPPRRRHPVHDDAPGHPRLRPRHRRRRCGSGCSARAAGMVIRAGRRRPRHGLGDGHQHPAHLRDRLRRRLGAGGLRRRHRRVVREPRARASTPTGC